jgi:hypothetical protein
LASSENVNPAEQATEFQDFISVTPAKNKEWENLEQHRDLNTD